MAPSDMPKVPPRPARTHDRTLSPNPDSFPRSPLNEVPNLNISGKGLGMYSDNSHNASSSSLSLPQRPPSVSLPSIGQEGNEYAELQYREAEGQEVDNSGGNEPTQTRNVGCDLPLHAPRPSFSDSTAKARVSGVTRTDSVQAAAVGIGKAPTPISSDDKDPHLRKLQSPTSQGSFIRPDSSASTERPSSGQAGDSDHGIPEIPGIGQRVPMYPNAGDVQAPSPSPFSQAFPSGIGFHNQSTKPRHHGRTRSGREVFHGPPGSYGLHGHGSAADADQFEKAWYEKHPESLERDGHGQYGPGIGGGRGEYALSSEDLNKLVRETAKRGSGFGTSPGIPGLPNEQFGYMASEEYLNRLNAPSQSATYLNKAHSNHSQPHVESPLRKASFPVDVEGKETFDKSKGTHSSTRTGSSENALESDTDDESVHVKPPSVRKDKITGNGYDPPTQDLGPRGGNTEAQGGWIEETGYGVPILASDEVAKELRMEYMQPAVSPAQSRRGSQYYAGVDSEAPPSYQSGFRTSSRSGSAANSRPSSRPGSIHGTLPNLAKFTSHDDREDIHTPLEDVDEYEPLFPNEDGKEGRPTPASERFKRREMKRFPSQDIWEDTPNSLQLEATVNTPELIESQASTAAEPSSSTFETPEAEKARKGEVSEQEKAKLVPREERLAKSNFKPHLREEMQRPGSRQRFPSRDIWEDSPDSARLEATVGGSQEDDPRSPPDEGLRAGAVVSTSGRPVEGIIAGEQSREGATAGAAAMHKPAIPPRPPKGKSSMESYDAGAQPVPSVPARPPRRIYKVPPPDAEVPPLPSKLSSVTMPVETKDNSPTEARKGPALPERAKPEIPPRPANPIARDSNESVPLSKVTSTTSTGSGIAEDDTQAVKSPPPAPKPKPAVPSRPAGSKIAALKAGFLSDLDKKLQLGTQGPPKPQEKSVSGVEKEEEKAPLADARKTRARGPARRKPAASSANASNADLDDQQKDAEARNWVIQEPWAVWQLDEEGVLTLSPAESSTSSVVGQTPLLAYSKSIQESTSAMVTETAKQLDAQGTALAASLAKDTVASQAPVSLEQATASKDAEAASEYQIEPMTETSNSNELNTPTSSADPHDPAATSNATSQSGEKNIKANIGTDTEERITAIVGGGAHRDGGDIFIGEREKSDAEGK